MFCKGGDLGDEDENIEAGRRGKAPVTEEPHAPACKVSCYLFSLVSAAPCSSRRAQQT